MARGFADWGAMAAKETVYGLADLGEVVARLGGIQVYSRSGDMIYFDSFEHGYEPWSYALSGAASALALVTSRWRSNGYALSLRPGTGAAPSVQVSRELAVIPAGAWGYEASFTLNLQINYVELLGWYFSGSERIQAVVRIYPVTGRITIQIADLSWVDLATGLSLRTTDTLFHTAKLIFNTSTKLYKRLLFDSFSYDISAYGLSSQSDTTTPYLIPRYLVQGDATNNPTLYLDDVIITQNEP